NDWRWPARRNCFFGRVQNRRDVISRHIFQIRIQIYLYYRSRCARTQTFDFLKREAAVRGGGAGFDAEPLFEFLYDCPCALQAAWQVRADLKDCLGRWLIKE